MVVGDFYYINRILECPHFNKIFSTFKVILHHGHVPESRSMVWATALNLALAVEIVGNGLNKSQRVLHREAAVRHRILFRGIGNNKNLLLSNQPQSRIRSRLVKNQN